MMRKKKNSPARKNKMSNLPGGMVNAQIARFLSGKNVNALRKASRNIKHYVKAPSQMRMAKSMLPRNFGRKPVSLKLSKMTGMVPAHLPLSAGGRYTVGHNTIQNLLARYTMNQEKQARLERKQNNMEHNQRTLGTRIKKSLNKLTKPRNYING
jgi:hypothetical protein